MGFSSSRIFNAGRAVLATAAMVGCLGFAANAAMADEAAEVRWPDPQSVLSTKTYNDDGSVATQQILSSAKGTYNVLPLWLGIADTVCDSPAGINMDGTGEYTAQDFETSGLFGTYASPANAEPTDTAEGPAEDEAAQQGGQGQQQGGAQGQGGGQQGAQGGQAPASGGSITVSLADLAQADAIVYTGQNTTGVAQSDVEEAFAAAGITDIPTGIYVNPTNVGTGNYDADKCVFTLNWLGAVYPEAVTSTDLLAYFYSQIAHVSDDYLANVLALNCANMTLVGEDTLSHDNAYYTERVGAVQSVVDEGMGYLTANLDQIVAEHSNLEPVKDADGAYRDRNLGL